MLLWWIPFIGQAVAGYVGGRKAGTAVRGMIAAGVSAMVLIGIVMVLSAGIIGGFDFLNSEPHDLVASAGTDFPIIGPILALILTYMQGLFFLVAGTTSMKIPIYVITVIFGMVGGALAEQHAKEVARSAPEEGSRSFMPRSLAAYVTGKKLGFENFDDRISIQQSKVPETKVVTVQRSLVRKVTAREEPIAAVAAETTVAVQNAEQRESPFAGLIHRAEKNDPEKERVRHNNSQEDLEYV
jgi:hypothetical protein